MLLLSRREKGRRVGDFFVKVAQIANVIALGIPRILSMENGKNVAAVNVRKVSENFEKWTARTMHS